MTPEETKAFTDAVPELRKILAKRRSSWTLTTIDWEDVESILLTRLWQKFDLYKPDRGPLENWANTVITRALSNLLRDNLMKWAKPCASAGAYGGLCAFNDGLDKCRYTPSGKQCSECPLYARWAKKKESGYNINSSLPLEHHDMEVQNLQEDFIDYDYAKRVIDARILIQLNPYEAKIYRLLFIDGLSMEDTTKRMKLKTQANSEVSQVLRKMVIRFRVLGRQIIESEDLA